MTVTQPVEESLAASLQHLDLLNRRITKLLEAREETEQQLLHRAGAAHRTGELDTFQLADLYERYRDMNLAGRSKRWNENIDMHWHVIARIADYGRPNGPENTWIGEGPTACNEPCPERGQSVVYVLYGEDNEPCYVGSTRSFRARLKAHERDGKHFCYWQAYLCRDREHAFQLEERLLKERLPRLNRKAAR